MSHKVQRLVRSKIDNVPALICEDNLRELVSYLEGRTQPHAGISSEQTQRKQMVLTDNLAMLNIQGTLTYEDTWMSALCGMTSYQSLLSDVEKAAKAGIKTFVFDADSGGGEAYAMMDTANSIRARIDSVGGKMITYVDGTCASACLGLAVVSDEIIAHPDARTGSVGVVVKAVNDSKANKEKGYETVYITSAKSKVPFDKEGNFSEAFLKDIQADVNKLHSRFAQHVADNRGMSLEAVNDTQAKVYDSDKALEIGFIDKIMNHDEFFSYLEDINEDNSMPLHYNRNSKDKNLETTQDEIEMSTEQVSALETKLEKSIESQEALQAKLDEQLALTSDLQSKLEEANASIEQFKQKAEDDKLASRKASLAEVLPEDKVESVFNAVAGLDDTSFNAILSTYQLNQSLEESETNFNEVGVSGESNEDETVSSVMKVIKANKEA